MRRPLLSQPGFSGIGHHNQRSAHHYSILDYQPSGAAQERKAVVDVAERRHPARRRRDQKGVLAMNPAREVKTERFSRTEGQTPAFVEGEVQKLLGVIETTTHTGLRDRALLGVLAYTFARIGAVVNPRSKTIILPGNGSCFALERKAVKRKSFPCTTSSKS